MKFGGALLSLLMVTTSASAQEPGEGLRPLAITFTEEGVGGPGGELLREAMTTAQIVAVGEAHGYRGPPQLTRALALSAQDGDPFDALVVEVGPYSAQFISESLREGAVEGYSTVLADRILAVPFLNLRDDAEMALPFVDGTIADNGLWGVDQEFIASSLIHFETLQELATTQAQRELAATLFEQEKAAVDNFDMGSALLSHHDEERFETLKAGFEGNDAALNIIAAMETTARIYDDNARGAYYANNSGRARLLREQFLHYYHQEDEQPPRVLMRLGSLHLAKGITPVHTFDLGSLIEGMAAANGKEALHIVYSPISGQRSFFNPRTGEIEIVDGGTAELRGQLEAIGYDMSSIDDGGHYVIDLETVRSIVESRGLNEVDDDAYFVLLGYDYLVTTVAAEAGRPLGN